MPPPLPSSPSPSSPRGTFKRIRSNQTILQWKLLVGSTNPNETLSMVADGCHLAYTRDEEVGEARTCLSSKSIVFIGNSLTRYQYLSFVNYIEHGRWTDMWPHLASKWEWPPGEFHTKVSGPASSPLNQVPYCPFHINFTRSPL